MKETIDFVRAVGALEGFPIHDELLSDRGRTVAFNRLNEMTATRVVNLRGGSYARILRQAGSGPNRSASCCNGFMEQHSVTVGIGPVLFEDLEAVARHDAQVVIADDALAEVRKSREIIEALADDQQPHYGVSTGFGAWQPGTSRWSCAVSCSAA